MRSQKRGLSLTELVVSFFLIAYGILIVMQLFQSAMKGQKEAERSLVAANLAERILAEARRRSGTTWPPAPFGAIDPDSGYVYSVQVAAQSLYSPCTTLEMAYPIAQRRALTQSAYRLKVTVNWNGSQSLSAVTMVHRRAPTGVRLRVQPDGPIANPLMPNQVARYRVDPMSGGVVVPDIFCIWGVTPNDGNGMLYQPDRTGATCGFEHAYRDRNGVSTYFTAPARGSMEVQAMVNGTLITNTTGDINLNQ